MTPNPPSTAPAIVDPLRDEALIVELIASVTAEPPERVRQRLADEQHRPGSSVADDFARRGIPRYQWSDQLLEFYSQTDAFLYELAVWNRNRLKSAERRWIIQRLAERHTQKPQPRPEPLRILCLGDGMGFDSVALAQAGHHVSYFEVPGRSYRFAEALFARMGLAVNMVPDFAALPPAGFDVVVCLDVLEHVPDPPAYLRQIVALIRHDGWMFASAPFHLILPAYPTHLAANRRYAGSLALYRQAGLRVKNGHFAWDPLLLTRGRDIASPLRRAWLGLGGCLLAVGRLNSFIFRYAHWLRRMHNRPFR